MKRDIGMPYREPGTQMHCSGLLSDELAMHLLKPEEGKEVA